MNNDCNQVSSTIVAWSYVVALTVAAFAVGYSFGNEKALIDYRENCSVMSDSLYDTASKDVIVITCPIGMSR